MWHAGLGIIYAIPSGANPTPIPFASAKSAGVDIKQTLKEYRGQYRFPKDVLATEANLTVKFGHTDFRAKTLGLLLSGGVTAANTHTAVVAEQATVPGSSAYTVQVAGYATFLEDAGVYNVTTGSFMSCGAAAAPGVYAVASGTYTFDVSNKSSIVLISYTKSTTSSALNTTTVTNSLFGADVAYKVRIYTNWAIQGQGTSKSFGLELPACHFNSLGWALKSDDFAEESLDGFAAEDPTTGIVAYALGE